MEETITIKEGIGVIDNTLPPELCERIIAKTEESLDELGASSRTGDDTAVVEFLISDKGVSDEEWSEIDATLSATIGQALNKYLSQVGGVPYLEEVTGTGYVARKHFMDARPFRCPPEALYSGGFVQVFVLLNRTEDFAAIEFPRQALRVRAMAGRIVLAPANWVYPYRSECSEVEPQYLIRTMLYRKVKDTE
jgi:hypothetical protein